MAVLNKYTRALLDEVHNPGEISRRLERIDDPPVEELNDWVRQVRRERDDSTIPWFDPSGGGTAARLLFLAQDPSEVAAKGSGFISPDNNDPTAANTTLACRAAGIPASDRVHWNIIPWWAANPAKPKAGLQAHVAAAAPYFRELIANLLPRLEVVVLLGRPAQSGWATFELMNPWHGLHVLRCPHPSPLAWNKVGPGGRKNGEATVACLGQARELLRLQPGQHPDGCD